MKYDVSGGSTKVHTNIKGLPSGRLFMAKRTLIEFQEDTYYEGLHDIVKHYEKQQYTKGEN